MTGPAASHWPFGQRETAGFCGNHEALLAVETKRGSALEAEPRFMVLGYGAVMVVYVYPPMELRISLISSREIDPQTVTT